MRLESPSPQSVQAIFVVGSPRSGTTLIGNYIGSCPAICNLGEYAGFFLSYYVAVREYLRVPTPYKQDYLGEIQSHARVFAEKAAQAHNNQFYCDCTPWNLLIARELAAVLPEALFILSLRHYSGVIQSLERSYQGGYEWAGASWTQRAELWRRFYTQVRFLPPERTVPVSYDHLCANPLAIAALKQALESRGLPLAGIDEGQLALSHATSRSRPRPTIGVPSSIGPPLLRSIPSFDPQCWTRAISEAVRPIVEPTHALLEQFFPGVYAKPVGFSEAG